jgi:hypothetical protein
VIETRGPELGTRPIRESFVLAEDHAEHERPTHSADSPPDRPLDPISDAVSDAGEPAASTDLPPCASTYDDVDPLARQPGSLVEATFGLTWLGDPSRGLDDCTPWRRSTHRKQEENPLAEAPLAESPHLGLRANSPRRCSRGTDDDELGTRGLAYLGRKCARVHRIEPEPSPPQTRDDESASDRDDSCTTLEKKDRGQNDARRDNENLGRNRHDVRGGEPGAGGADE